MSVRINHQLFNMTVKHVKGPSGPGPGEWCRDPFQLQDNAYCTYVESSTISHTDAVVECDMYGGNLVTVDSQQKSDVLASILSAQSEDNLSVKGMDEKREWMRGMTGDGYDMRLCSLH